MEKSALYKAMNLQFTFATVIPECLQGNIVLQGIAQFMQVTDKLDHSGLVLVNNHFVKGKEYCSINNKVYFAKSTKYKSHYYPKEWVKLWNNDLIVPYDYAYNAELEVYINEDDDYNYLSDSDIVFSHSCGYYNSEDKTVHDHELYDRDDIVTLYNGYTCHIDNACYIDSKNDWYYEDDCVLDHNNDYILADEAIRVGNEWYHETDDNIRTCDDCNENFHYEDLHYNEDDDCDYCEQCYPDHIKSSSLNRMCYSSNVLNYKGFGNTDLKINNKSVFLGLELECLVTDGYEDEVNEFSRNCDYAIATEDASLDRNLGIEYIFRPEGLEQQKENVEDFINEISDYLEHTKARYYDNDYGLHVHVSSHFLGQSTKLKIQNFVNDNFCHIEEIGGRSETGYQKHKTCHWNTLDDARYRFVNINNRDTLEFRFPAAIIDQDHINMNLELALAITMFCKFNLSLLTLKKDCHKAWLEFYSYLMDNKKTYPLLVQQVDEMFINSINESIQQVNAA